VAKAIIITAAYGTAESRAPSKREVLMNNAAEAPHYPSCRIHQFWNRSRGRTYDL